MGKLRNPFTKQDCNEICFICNKNWYNELNIPNDFSEILSKISNQKYKEYLINKYSQEVFDKFIEVYSNTSKTNKLISFSGNFDIRKKFRGLCEEIFGFKEGLYLNGQKENISSNKNED